MKAQSVNEMKRSNRLYVCECPSALRLRHYIYSNYTFMSLFMFFVLLMNLRWCLCELVFVVLIV